MHLRIAESAQSRLDFGRAWDGRMRHLTRTVPHSVRYVKPLTVRGNPYLIRVAQDPRSFLWANICELMGGTPTIDAVQERTHLGRGTVQRIRDGDAAIRISSIHTVADNLGVEVWQLLLPPDLDQLAVIEAAARKKRQQLTPATDNHFTDRHDEAVRKSRSTRKKGGKKP